MDRRSHFETPPSHQAKGQVHLPHVIHPQFSQPVRATIDLVESEDDELATAQTIRLMCQYAREDSRSPIVRTAAAAAARLAQGNSPGNIAAAVWAWIRQRVRFQLDSETAIPVTDTPEAAELLIRPVDLLTMPQPAGDCDDQSMLCAALLRALGIDSSFKTVAAEAGSPDLYSHVYVIAHTPEGDLALDCSHGPFAGWEVEPAGKTRVWRIEDMHGLGTIDWGKIIEIGTKAGADIATARYGQPPEGTYIQQGSNVVYRQPANASALSFPGVNVGLDTGTSGGSLILIVGAVVLLFALTRNR
jgi:hypothetical protein